MSLAARISPHNGSKVSTYVFRERRPQVAALAGRRERPSLAPTQLQRQVANRLAVQVGAHGHAGGAGREEDGHGERGAQPRRADVLAAAQQRRDALGHLQLVEEPREAPKDHLRAELGGPARDDAGDDLGERRAAVGNQPALDGSVGEVVDDERPELPR